MILKTSHPKNYNATDLKKPSIKKSKKAKSNKKSKEKIPSLKKNEKKEIKNDQCNVIYLDNVNSSSLCPNAEKMYKKTINGKSMKPSEKDKIVSTAKEYLLKT